MYTRLTVFKLQTARAQFLWSCRTKFEHLPSANLAWHHPKLQYITMI